MKEAPIRTQIVSWIRSLVSVQTAVMALIGALAGYSITLLEAGAVALPIVGSVPAWTLGGAGLVVSAVAYRQFGCCGVGTGADDCGCSGDCSDRCSYDPEE